MYRNPDIKKLQPWNVLERQLVLEFPPWVSLWRETLSLPDGRIIEDYYQVGQRDYVEVVAWQDGKVLGLWRYKHGPRQVNLGLPAGYLEPGEDRLTAARRELQEEVGLVSEDWKYSNSFCIDGNRGPACAHIYQAFDCQLIGSCGTDDLEEHLEEWLTPAQWQEQLKLGAVVTLGVAVAVYSCILSGGK